MRIPANPESVLLVRPDHLGDLVLFSGALPLLRERFPQARLDLAVQGGLVDFMAECPHVDRVLRWEDLALPSPTSSSVSIPGRGWIQRKRRSRSLRRALGVWDLLILPLRSPTASIHAAVATIPARTKLAMVGDHSNITPEAAERAARGYHDLFHIAKGRERDHELAVARDFLQALGCLVEEGGAHPRIWLNPEDEVWAQRWIPPESEPVLALAPGVTSMEGKFLPGSWYVTGLAPVEALRGVRIVVLGSPAEKAQCREVTEALGNAGVGKAVQDLSGTTTLGQLTAVLARSQWVISQETGALHLGMAAGRPCVGIVGGGHFGRFFPWGERGRAVHHPMDCYHCNWACIYPTLRCIHEIPPSTLTREVEWLLQREGSTP